MGLAGWHENAYPHAVCPALCPWGKSSFSTVIKARTAIVRRSGLEHFRFKCLRHFALVTLSCSDDVVRGGLAGPSFAHVKRRVCRGLCRRLAQAVSVSPIEEARPRLLEPDGWRASGPTGRDPRSPRWG